MRLAHFLALLGLAALTARAADATDPAAPAAPLQHPPLPASGAVVEGPGDWKAANAAVGEFPRGHADIVRWEAARQPAPTAAEPSHHDHHHHGGKP